MAKTAFISYASDDEAVATAITTYLERNRVSCWIAPRDARPGADYAAEIIDAIETSAVFVLVLSENANRSAFVSREVERAVSKGKPVFPIRVREVVPSKSLELFISSAHWIDAFQPPIEQYLERLAESIRSAAGVYAADGSAPPRVEPPTATPFEAARTPSPSTAPSGNNRRLLLIALAAALVVVGAMVGRNLWRTTETPASTGGGAVAGGRAVGTPAAVAAPAPLAGADTANRTPPETTASAPTSTDPCPRNLSSNLQLPTPFSCVCAAQFGATGSVWGTDVYTDDSTLCRAALHAGVIPVGGGPITVTRKEGRSLYVGSARNGVESSDYGEYPRTIEFKGTARAPSPELCPRSLSVNRALPTPFTCRCTAEKTRSGSVWGTDVYTDDSSICAAGVHAGVISPSGGTVTVVRADGRQIYAGSERHGITSSDFGPHTPSIQFQK